MGSGFVVPSRFHLTCGFAMLLLSCCAEAQLIPCSSVGGTGPYKIFVDEVKTLSGTPASPTLLKSLSGLRDFLVTDLNTLTAGQASVRRCNDRFPQDPGDFDDAELNSLDNLRVLLEVWGAVQDPVRERGILGFVLVPARPLAPPAVYVVRRDGRDFLAQAKRGTELRVFAPLALGIRAYQNRRYEESVPLLCQGAHELDTLLKKPASAADAPLRADQQTLLTKVRTVIDDAITRARSNPESRYMLLRPAPDNRFACPAAGGS